MWYLRCFRSGYSSSSCSPTRLPVSRLCFLNSSRASSTSNSRFRVRRLVIRSSFSPSCCDSSSCSSSMRDSRSRMVFFVLWRMLRCASRSLALFFSSCSSCRSKPVSLMLVAKDKKGRERLAYQGSKYVHCGFRLLRLQQSH